MGKRYTPEQVLNELIARLQHARGDGAKKVEMSDLILNTITEIQAIEIEEGVDGNSSKDN